MTPSVSNWDPFHPADLGWLLGAGLLNVLVVLLVAPLFEGGLRRITARLQSRQGPPLLQPYYDLLKLLGKEDLDTAPAPAIQRWAAYFALATPLAIACTLPLGFPAPWNGVGDVIQLAYLVTLSSVATLIAGFAAGSPFSLLGANRELLTMIFLEPLLVIALIAGAIRSGSFRLDEVLQGGLCSATHPTLSGFLLLGVLLAAFQGFLQRLPFDIAEAETEIMDGPLVEYSGPKLALFKHARMARLVLYSALLVGLCVPWGCGWPFPIGWAWFWVKVAALVLLATLIAATHARYRIDQALRFFATLFGLALAALALACFGY